ncbi:hypothetical protein [Clostridium psychrophilum]|uniref:hypothetical protein n=1 Tax=Clostridium psychrophilum TaxID=132926 RepID=UPI001C0E31DB|nr:hypothetical protein [Clostridium psychrophilum]MBU3181964.1 hypothetical protein [Clostridium psychrophilum]
MKKIEDYTPDELVALTSIIGILIGRKFTAPQKLAVASIFSGIAQILVISVAQENLIASQENADINLDTTNKNLQKQIDELKKHIEKLEDDKNI